MQYETKKENKIGENRTLSAVKQYGILVADNERYLLYDLRINELTVSLTELKPMQETRGHSHMESEIYFFVGGKGRMQIGNQEYDVEKGDVMFIPRKEFHKVINPDNDKLIFAAVFEGSRASKRYVYSDK